MTRLLFFVLPAVLIAVGFWYAFPNIRDQFDREDTSGLARLTLLLLVFCGGVSAYRFRQVWLPTGAVVGALFSMNYVEWQHACCMPSPPWGLQNMVLDGVLPFLVTSLGWVLGLPVRKLPPFRSYAS